MTESYKRYHIDTAPAPDVIPWPSRFRVRVGRLGLAKLLIKELYHYRGDLELALSRPCVYGVFSGPLGGFMPRERLCVGCLRCTTQHPDFVEVTRNPARRRLGDSYFTAEFVGAVAYEAATGNIPVKGAGYRGRFAGDGWDGLWTDMSEIVRPTRDGIHGREFISTVVDIGGKPQHLSFDENGRMIPPAAHVFQLPLPMLFGPPPPVAASRDLYQLMVRAAAHTGTLAFVPLEMVRSLDLSGNHVAPLVGPGDESQLTALPVDVRLIVMTDWSKQLFDSLRHRFGEAVIAVQLPFGQPDRLLALLDSGVRVFWLTADYHGRTADGRFVFDLIREAHLSLVDVGQRDRVTLLGSGGLVAAEHVPKAIIAGLDAVVLDTPLLVALQAEFEGEFRSPDDRGCGLPSELTVEWGVQRLQNLMAAWRDQLLEILGAMGLREVRRLRGEMGRAMLAKDLEREAFAGIEGYDGH
ncbi:MAG: hypothetical protein R3300_18340 [Candidatus Promineifilaceae bacterium]|nr:hypothetical protein [Candidatus Promineifilaceae bacterium]